MGITNPHDLIFKQTESHIENAIDYLKGTCPERLVKNLDFSTMKLEKSTYISDELKEYFSDLVYQCVYKGKTKINITLLFEHKSYKPEFPLIQLLQYMINIWKTQLKEKRPLTIVIPVLFYHGKEKWELCKFKDYFNGIDDYLKLFIPEFTIVMTDISGFSDEQIKTNLFDREANKVLFLLMKHIFDKGYLEAHLKELLEAGKNFFECEEGIKFLTSILLYLYTTVELETEKIAGIVDNIVKEGGELAMTTAMKLKEEGIKEGIKEEKFKIAKKMKKEGLDINLIQKITGLSKEEIDKL